MMAEDLQTPYNFVYNKTVPHSNETLQEYLGYKSKAMFLQLIRKLIQIGVLYQMKGVINDQVRIIYMFNPLIARKRKTIDENTMKLFKDIRLLNK